MQELEKILEEIVSEFDRRIGIQLKIMAGLGDDVYRYGYGKSLEAYQQGKLLVTEIISKHMNDGWIPADEAPEPGKRCIVKIKHHAWTSDYNSSWVPESEQVYHVEYTEICEAIYRGDSWIYLNPQDGEYPAYTNPEEHPEMPVDEVLEWKYMPQL